MAPRRKLDWEEARRLRREGLTYAEIGRHFELSEDAVRYACDEEARAKARQSALATMRRKRRAGEYRHHDLAVCPRCLRVKSRHGRVCRKCYELERDNRAAA